MQGHDLEHGASLQLMTLLEKDSAGICQLPIPPVAEEIIVSVPKWNLGNTL